MAHIDYYFSTLSPFTYMAGTRMEGAYSLKGGKKALPFEITWEGR